MVDWLGTPEVTRVTGKGQGVGLPGGSGGESKGTGWGTARAVGAPQAVCITDEMEGNQERGSAG